MTSRSTGTNSHLDWKYSEGERFPTHAARPKQNDAVRIQGLVSRVAFGGPGGLSYFGWRNSERVTQRASMSCRKLRRDAIGVEFVAWGKS